MRNGNPRCALCGSAIEQTDTGVEYCSSCGIEDPPTRPLALPEIQATCEDAAWAIGTLEPKRQAGWLAYVLEALDQHNGTAADRVLEELQGAIDTRREVGRW